MRAELFGNKPRATPNDVPKDDVVVPSRPSFHEPPPAYQPVVVTAKPQLDTQASEEESMPPTPARTESLLDDDDGREHGVAAQDSEQVRRYHIA